MKSGLDFKEFMFCKTTEKIALSVTVFLFAFTLAFLFGSLSFVVRDSNAESSVVGVEIDPVLSMALSDDTLSLTADSIAGYAEVSDSLKMIVSTNNATGFVATMSAKGTDTALVHSNGTSRVESTDNIVAEVLGMNTWGYNSGATATTFRQIPVPASPASLKNLAYAVENDETDVVVGARINLMMPSGLYSNELVFSVVANPTPIPDFVNWTGGDIYIDGAGFDANSTVEVAGSACQSTKLISETLIRCTLPSLTDRRMHDVVAKDGSNNTIAHKLVLYDGTPKGKMQAFAWEQCAELERGQAQVWTDSRNNQTYRIKKMQDGKCWMIDNLRYEYGTLISGSTTSVNTSAQRIDPGTASSANYCSAGADLSTCYGYLYNWYGATYGTGTNSISSGDVAGNICPNSASDGSTTATTNGWRLPKAMNTATSDVGILNAGMAGDDGSTTNWTANNTNSNTDVNFKNNWYPTGPFQGAYSGGYSSGLNTQGSNGYYWSSAAASATNVYRLSFNSSGMSPAGNFNKTFGYALRCLISEPEPDFVNWTGGDIYVEGTDFTTGTVVSVDGTACQSTKYISETLVRCTLPSKSNGTTNDVTVSVGTATHPGVTYDGTNKGNMQEFRTEQCATMNRGQVQVWTDSRNSQTYRVKKMQDGKCWMIDNLRYADASWPQPDSGKYMTIDGTDTQSAENSPWTGYKSLGTAAAAGCSAGSDLSTCYGYLYNWHTATYGTGLYTVASGDVNGNICPNSSSTGSTTATNGGWRLPKGTNTATSDIGILNAGMAGDDGATTNWTANNTNSNTDVNFKNNWYPTGPYQGAYSGYYYSSLNVQGGDGYYWSSTASSATSARNLTYYSSGVNPASSYGKYLGFAVRCLVE